MGFFFSEDHKTFSGRNNWWLWHGWYGNICLITVDKSGNNICHFAYNWTNIYFVRVPVMDERIILSLQVLIWQAAPRGPMQTVIAFIFKSKVSHPRCVYINNRCRYQSIAQQYLKRCLIKDDNNYMFRHIAAIIRFSSESMVVVLYRIGMVMSRWWDLNICDVCMWYC